MSSGAPCSTTISPVATTGAQATSSNLQSVTTPASSFNGTGSNGILVAVSALGNTTGTVTDSSGNTYSLVSTVSNNGTGQTSLYCTYNPTVTSNMTFTYTSHTSPAYPSIGVLGVSGLASCAVDQKSALNQTGVVTSVQPGSITPSQNNELWISTVNTESGGGAPTSSGTLVYSKGIEGGVAYGIGMAYGVQTTATAVNPLWSWTTSASQASAGAWSFESSQASCSQPSGTYYTAGTVVNLAATAASGYQFSSWTGPVATNSATTTVTMTAPTAVTANFQLSAPAVTGDFEPATEISSLNCTHTSLRDHSSSTCTVSLSQAAPTGGTNVALTSSNHTLTVPAWVTVPAAATSTSFNIATGPISSSQSAIVTASLGVRSSSVTIALNSDLTPASLNCSSSTLTPGDSATCTVTLNRPVAGLNAIAIASSSPGLLAPSVLAIVAGTTASFTASAATAITAAQTARLTVTLNNVSAVANIVLAGTSSDAQAQLSRLSCTPASLTARSRGICRITLDHVGQSSASISLASSSTSLRLPEKIVSRPGQSTVEFEVSAVHPAEQVTIAASLGAGTLKEAVSVSPDPSTPIQVTRYHLAKPGTEVRFQALPSDPAATLSIEALPPGASFDASSGEFRWTPDATQLGAHELSFAATNPAGEQNRASVMIQVDSGEPVVTGIVNAATRSHESVCGPGAIAAIEGRWLADGAAADPSGNSITLAGAQVWANGAPVPILSASANQLTVLCPDSVPGAETEFVIQSRGRMANPIRTAVRAAAPGIFSLDDTGSGQGLILVESTGGVAMVRNGQMPGQPAISGDRLVLYATGIGSLNDISAQIGGYPALPAGVTPVPDYPGLYQVLVTLPESLSQGGNLAVSLSGNGPQGAVRTNIVTVAVETDIR